MNFLSRKIFLCENWDKNLRSLEVILTKMKLNFKNPQKRQNKGQNDLSSAFSEKIPQKFFYHGHSLYMINNIFKANDIIETRWKFELFVQSEMNESLSFHRLKSWQGLIDRFEKKVHNDFFYPIIFFSHLVELIKTNKMG